jgi:DNA modification methylase
MQLDLFAAVLDEYLHAGNLPNEALYGSLCARGAVRPGAFQERVPIGSSGEQHSLAKRRVRWIQQTMRAMGLIERIPQQRGVWRATSKAKAELTPAQPKVVLLGFHTELGIGIWGNAADVLSRIDQPVSLFLTSPPYPLRQPRAYGNPGLSEYVDFITATLEPIMRTLAPGGVVALNVTNDIFVEGSPERSTYREELVLAIKRRCGLALMDTLIWHNPSKPPGPIQWASKQRMQLGVAYEQVLYFTNDPHLCKADNRRVLQPHSEAQRRLIERGGEKRHAINADGAYRLKPGSYGNATAGSIQRNVLSISHNCPSQRALRARTDALGLPRHGAVMPLKLARLLVEFFCPPGELVVDPFAGSFTTARAAEDSGRRWICGDKHLEYVLLGKHRMESAPS